MGSSREAGIAVLQNETRERVRGEAEAVPPPPTLTRVQNGPSRCFQNCPRRTDARVARLRSARTRQPTLDRPDPPFTVPRRRWDALRGLPFTCPGSSRRLTSLPLLHDPAPRTTASAIENGGTGWPGAPAGGAPAPAAPRAFLSRVAFPVRPQPPCSWAGLGVAWRGLAPQGQRGGRGAHTEQN